MIPGRSWTLSLSICRRRLDEFFRPSKVAYFFLGGGEGGGVGLTFLTGTGLVFALSLAYLTGTDCGLVSIGFMIFSFYKLYHLHIINVDEDAVHSGEWDALAFVIKPFSIDKIEVATFMVGWPM